MIGNPASFTQPEMYEVITAMDLALNTALCRSLSGDTQPFYPCECTDCPLHTGYTGGDEGCSFCGDADAPLDSDMKGYIYDAVTVHRCTRGCIGEICAREFPDDQPEPEPYICTEEDCPLCDFGDICELHEDGSAATPYEDKHIIAAAEDFRCTRKFVRRRYGEIINREENDNE